MEQITAQDYERLILTVYNDMKLHGWADDMEIDDVFAAQRGRVGPLERVTTGFERSHIMSTPVQTALLEWYKFFNQDISTMISAIIKHYGWTRAAWTRIQQLYIVCVYPEFYAKAVGHGPVQYGAFEAACYVNDDISKVTQTEF